MEEEKLKQFKEQLNTPNSDFEIIQEHALELRKVLEKNKDNELFSIKILEENHLNISLLIAVNNWLNA